MRISDDIESIIESVEPTIDHIIDQELEFDSVVEAAASLDVVDPVDIANDDEINEIVNTAIGAGLITDNDVDDIASGKISISDEVDEEAEKADKEIEEYADDAIRDGILAREEVEAILNGIPVMEALDIDFDEDQDSFDEEELVCIAGDDESFNESIAEKLGIKKPADEKSRAKALKALGSKVVSTVRGVFGRDKGEVIEKLTKEDEQKFIKNGKSVKICQLQYNPFMAKRRADDRKKGLGVGYAPGVGLYLKDKDYEDFSSFAKVVGDKLKDEALKYGCRIYSSELKDLKERIKKRQGLIISWYLEPRKYFFESEESELDMANAALTFDTGINFNEADDIDAIFSFDEESTPQPTQSGKEVASKPQAGQTDKAQAGETNQKPPVPGTPKQEEDEDLVDRDDNAIDMEVDDAPTFEGDRKAYHDDDDSDDELEERITIDSDDDDDDHEDFDDDGDEDHDDDSDDDDDDKGVFKMDESMKLNFVEQAQEVCQEMDLNKVDTMNTFDGAGINADDVEFGYKGPQVGADEKNFDDSFKKEDTVPDNIFKDSFWDYDLDPSIEDMEIGK